MTLDKLLRKGRTVVASFIVTATLATSVFYSPLARAEEDSKVEEETELIIRDRFFKDDSKNGDSKEAEPESPVTILPQLSYGIMSFGGTTHGGYVHRPSLRLDVDIPLGNPRSGKTPSESYNTLSLSAQGGLLFPLAAASGKQAGRYTHGFSDWRSTTNTENPDQYGFFSEVTSQDRSRESSTYHGFLEVAVGYDVLPLLAERLGLSRDVVAGWKLSPSTVLGVLSRNVEADRESISSIVTYQQQAAGKEKVANWQGKVVPAAERVPGVHATCYAQGGLEGGYRWRFQGSNVGVSGVVRYGGMVDGCFEGSLPQGIEVTTAEVNVNVRF